MGALADAEEMLKAEKKMRRGAKARKPKKETREERLQRKLDEMYRERESRRTANWVHDKNNVDKSRFHPKYRNP